MLFILLGVLFAWQIPMHPLYPINCQLRCEIFLDYLEEELVLFHGSCSPSLTPASHDLLCVIYYNFSVLSLVLDCSGLFRVQVNAYVSPDFNTAWNIRGNYQMNDE